MKNVLQTVTAVFGRSRQSLNKPRVGVFSVVQGKRKSLEKLGTHATNMKCRGECTCRCG